MAHRDRTTPLFGTNLRETDRAANVLVTGAAGFIGANLTSQLLASGARVVAVDDLSAGSLDRLPLGAPGLEFRELDVSEPRGLGRLLAEFSGEDRPDVVVHLAARVGVRTILADPLACERENLAGARELASAVAGLPRAHRPRVIAASSSEVYVDSPAELSETAPLRPTEARGRWRYAAAKLAAEHALDRAARWSPGQGPLHLRFFNVVGPGQDSHGGMVLPRFVEAALAGGALTVHGDGEQVRTFAHVDDVARDILGLVERLRDPHDETSAALNLGGTARTTIGALAELVADEAAALGLPRPAVERVDPREAVSRQFEEVRCRMPDLTRARSLGLASDPRSLAEIVRDSLERHVELAPTRSVRNTACASSAS